MYENLKHNCGIALLRLRKPLYYYHYEYNSWMYGINKLYLLLEKQHNRGQEGCGIAVLKLNSDPGSKYIYVNKKLGPQAILEVFEEIYNYYEKLKLEKSKYYFDPYWAKVNIDFAGELFLGHLRYGTYGEGNYDYLHPFIRFNNWKTRTLLIAGNFNFTNSKEMFDELLSLGQHPISYSDTNTILEKIGHILDYEVDTIFKKYKQQGYNNKKITELIIQEIDIVKIINNATWKWDGGYVIVGIIGSGHSFAFRDPYGIRPAFYYIDDEVIVVASERPAIQTSFNLKTEDVFELPPGHILIINPDASYKLEKFIEPNTKKSCSFERIYFSRGTDRDIYIERKTLGKLLAQAVLEEINYDIQNTIFTFIPNTALDAFIGLTDEIEKILINKYLNNLFLEKEFNEEKFRELEKLKIRKEKLIVKDLKLRTFITPQEHRKDLVAHIYDVTYGIVKPTDTIVVVDDSIVRGTTLKESILYMLDKLNPKKIIVVSSAPQIRYPDCYGIDMANLHEFIAFEAAIQLLKEKRKENIINYVYNKCKEQERFPPEKMVNYIKLIYDQFSYEEISDKISQILKGNDIKAELKVIFNTIENLHKACPNNLGDWYFSGDYPTPGGVKVVNSAFINYIENKKERAY